MSAGLDGSARLRRPACVAAALLAALVTAPATAAPHGIATGSLPVRARVLHFVDRSRTVRLPDGRRVPRPLATVVWYPATGGPYPLVVFGHGFALAPSTYRALLRAWAGAGYVVAAPVFPLENARAPGGPDESDLVNQPRDMSVVVTGMLRLDATAGGILGGRIERTRVAVAGHSDGAETALAAAYDGRYRDPRVRAAVVLSGAALPGMGAFPRGGPPLLAVQGTADPINAPANTTAYFAAARRPKFLLELLGASHLPPYTSQEPQLRIVERVSLAFLDHYLKGRPLAAIARAARGGRVRLTSDP
jgi:predicted dienelactone hydrolase